MLFQNYLDHHFSLVLYFLLEINVKFHFKHEIILKICKWLPNKFWLFLNFLPNKDFSIENKLKGGGNLSKYSNISNLCLFQTFSDSSCIFSYVLLKPIKLNDVKYSIK